MFLEKEEKIKERSVSIATCVRKLVSDGCTSNLSTFMSQIVNMYNEKFL